MITATYRLQFHAAFGFRDAARIIDYLDALGISHAYASPYLSAVPGSLHGYDLVDPGTLNPELGGEPGFLAWTDALAARGMGHIVDVVPNHMGASTQNAWWSDVLENGPSSLYADHFDIEWHPPKAALDDKVLLPVLGAQYGDVLESGELTFERHGGAFCVRYFERCLPVSPPTVVPLLERAAVSVDLPAEDPKRQELQSIATGLRNLPASTERDPERRAERAREKEVLKRRLATLCEDPVLGAAVDLEVRKVNGTPGDARSFDELDKLLLDQSYRLAFWRVATEEINYRRFFDINDLAAVRMEHEVVFDDVHRLLLSYIRQGRIDGVRLDHTDGLYDPADYFVRLRRAVGSMAPPRELYVVAEKILEPREELPESWAVDGTTGYDFLVQVSGLFVDRRAEEPLTRLYEDVTGDRRAFAAHAHEGKRTIMRSSLSSEVHMLAQRLERIAMRDRRSRDFTLATLRRAVGETLAAFPVYRTYIRPDGSREPHDEQIVSRAVRLARRRNPEVSPSVFDFLRSVLLLTGASTDDTDRAARTEFAMRFQQLTGPVMAKGVEDTAFYTYSRFVMLNEVGGSPDRFGTSTEAFHAACEARRRSWPRAMTATGTHDMKRGEDVRARLAVVAEIPERWEAWVRAWLKDTEKHAATIEDEPAPSVSDRYQLLQTAFGALPFDALDREGFGDRLTAFAIKAAREAKVWTSWLSPDEAYEQALRGYIAGITSDASFVKSLEDGVGLVATHGASNGIAQRLLQIAAPGVPDTYQGSELWDLRLVDPDNRSPVDYAYRRELLASLETTTPAELLASYRDGRLKLHVVRGALQLRRAQSRVLLEGSYVPLDGGDEIVAFAREHDDGTVVAAVTRQPFRVTRGEIPWAVGDAWGARTVALTASLCGRFRDVLTGREHQLDGERVAAANLFRDLPVALLTLVRRC